jgi:hypothetical protein
MPVLWNKRRWNVDGDVTMAFWYKATFVSLECGEQETMAIKSNKPNNVVASDGKSEILLKHKAIIIIAHHGYVILFLIWFG